MRLVYGRNVYFDISISLEGFLAGGGIGVDVSNMGLLLRLLSSLEKSRFNPEFYLGLRAFLAGCGDLFTSSFGRVS